MKTVRMFLMLLLVLPVVVFAADKYEVDPGHSHVGFTVTHMVLSRVNGQFRDFSATIVLDEQKPENSSVNGVIKTASIDTGNKDRDEDLRSDHFFDVQKFPEITFASKSVKKDGDTYQVMGTLTMKGVSKEVTLPVKIAGPIKTGKGGKRIGISTSLKIDRNDYGITWSRTIEGGGLVVSNDVEITIDGEAATP